LQDIKRGPYNFRRKNLSRFLFDDESYKNNYINAIERLSKDPFLQNTENESSLLFEFDNIEELKNAKVINWDDDPKIEKWQDVIQKEESTTILCQLFKSDWGYYSNNDEGIEVPNHEIIDFFELVENSRVIDNLELIHPNLYLQRVSLTGNDIAWFESCLLDLQLKESTVKIRLNKDHSFLFSYKLLKAKHPEPLSYDSFIEISGSELDLEECRMICSTFIFELNCFSGLSLIPSPNFPNVNDEEFDEYVEAKRGLLSEFALLNRSFKVCNDTVKAIELYNRAISCEDNEISILYFSKVIEYVSETVVRMKVTEVGRKALSSNRSLMPDANFIKELQQLFKSHSYKKDSESMELTIQTCCYISDLIEIIPKFIKNKFENNRKQSDQAALQFLAKCISATRNNIAHAKANYVNTGYEVPEEHYDGFAQLMRLVSQQCIKWYSAQSPSMRIVS
tara:strand:+ start:129023 stop:130375 length:1353 start_codon:yes stop_codon:yes gene_type:complete